MLVAPVPLLGMTVGYALGRSSLRRSPGPVGATDIIVEPIMTFVQAATVPTPATAPLLLAGLFAGILCTRSRSRSAVNE
jgi:hypothetical protein